MKTVMLALIFFVSGNLFAKPPAITEVRMLYEKAASDEKSCKMLLDILAPYNEKNNPLFSGYKAVATMLMAKYVLSPFSKMSYFNRGKKMLSKSIEADVKNVELRFLRFTLQTNVPSFLFYTDEIKDDKIFILNIYRSNADQDLKKFMSPVLQNSGHISANEKQLLK